MKNHVYRNGRLTQINKKFSALTEKQKEWIAKEMKMNFASNVSARKMFLISL